MGQLWGNFGVAVGQLCVAGYPWVNLGALGGQYEEPRGLCRSILRTYGAERGLGGHCGAAGGERGALGGQFEALEGPFGALGGSPWGGCGAGRGTCGSLWVTGGGRRVPIGSSPPQDSEATATSDSDGDGNKGSDGGKRWGRGQDGRRQSNMAAGLAGGVPRWPPRVVGGAPRWPPRFNMAAPASKMAARGGGGGAKMVAGFNMAAPRIQDGRWRRWAGFQYGRQRSGAGLKWPRWPPPAPKMAAGGGRGSKMAAAFGPAPLTPPFPPQEAQPLPPCTRLPGHAHPIYGE